MLNVLFVCVAGMSTSLLVEKIKKEAENRGIEMQLKAVPEAETRKGLDEIDVLLLGPQVRYLEKQMQKMLEGKETKLGVVDMLAYGRMDAPKVLDQILDLNNR
ncbi:MAG: PTS sugar transporter subunit IIB [Defluviitaleaceae bacterium]|nr:PTS sugar transporter subunit IIB [Defluviitaleaceae bacterium]